MKSGYRENCGCLANSSQVMVQADTPTRKLILLISNHRKSRADIMIMGKSFTGNEIRLPKMQQMREKKTENGC